LAFRCVPIHEERDGNVLARRAPALRPYRNAQLGGFRFNLWNENPRDLRV